ncbi:MAG: TonB-dependent receptor family protein, partial [Bacteroidetes bacterium]|nr:TonB-dependent receptor family protein [Bacteroidota bacterium]
FPTAYLNYDADKHNSFTLSYGRRIQRPNYQDLNPFLWFLDSLSYRQGNPFLVPQYTNNIELRHTLNGGLTTTIGYTVTNDVISELLKQNTEKRITYLTPDNVAKLRNVSLSVNAPVKFFKWWSANIYAGVYSNRYTGNYYNSYTGKNDPLDISFTSFNINVSNTFNFPKGWSGELSGFYRSKGVDGLSINEPMYFMGLGAQKNVLKGRGTVRMNLRDPFHWQVYRGNTVYSDIDVRVHDKWDNRSLTFTLNYRFGKSTVPQARKHSGATGDEQSRVGGQQ